MNRRSFLNRFVEQLQQKQSGKRTISGASKMLNMADTEGWKWRVVIMQAGETATRDQVYDKECLKRSVENFEGVRAMMRHPRILKFNEDGSVVPDPTDVQGVNEIVGWYQNVQYVEDGEGARIEADFTITENADWLRKLIASAFKGGKTDLVQFSMCAWTTVPRQENGKFYVDEITLVDSVDIVAEGNAGGQLLRMLEAANKKPDERSPKVDRDKILAMLQAMHPELLKGVDPTKVTDEELLALMEKAMKSSGGGGDGNAMEMKSIVDSLKELKTIQQKGADSYADLLKKAQDASAKVEAVTKQLEERDKIEVTRGLVEQTLSKSGLPTPTADKLRRQWQGKILDQAGIDAAVKEERDVLAAIRGFDPMIGGGIEPGLDELDRHRLSMDGFFMGQDEKDKKGEKVPRFLSLKRAHATITRQSNMDAARILADCYNPKLEKRHMAYRGRTDAAARRVMESIDSTTFGEVFGDSIARILVREYQISDRLATAKKIVSDIVPVDDFRTQRRMTVGGYGTLPTVNQGQVYQSLTSPTDTEETYAVAKRGGTEDLTLEAIAADDTGAIRRIPRNLSNSAVETFFQVIFDIPRLGTQAMASGNNLISNGNSNSLALTLSETNLATARNTMRNFTVPGVTGAQHLGNVPKFLLIPNELETLAFKLTTGDKAVITAETATTPNLFKGMEPIILDYWTSATAWRVAADPRRVPTIEVGFFEGREDPELFVDDNPNTGSQFSQDKTTFKIRYILGAAAVDHRWIVGSTP